MNKILLSALILFLLFFALIGYAFFAGLEFFGEFESLFCGFLGGKDQDHCYQDSAVRASDPGLCANIKAADFSALEGPAPRDKCYLRIAEKTGDPSSCNKIVGGFISYTVEECVYRAAMTSKKDSICSMIKYDEGEYGKKKCLADLGK